MKRRTSGADGRKKTTRRAVALALAVLALGIAAVAFFARPRPLTVACIGLGDAEVQAYSLLFPSGSRVLRADLPRAGRGNLDTLAADVFITGNGLALERLRDRLLPPPDGALSSVPPSLIDAMKGGGKGPLGFPLQLDHVSLAWDTEAFAALGIAAPATRAEMEAAMRIRMTQTGGSLIAGPALLFAGGEDEALLQTLSVLCVSEYGAAGYARVVQAIRDASGTGASGADSVGAGPATFDAAFMTSLASAGAGQATLDRLVDILAAWLREGYLHPEWHKLKSGDVRAYMEKGLGFMVIGTLAFRRTVDYQSIYRYGTIPFPSGGGADCLVAPVTGLYTVKRGLKAGALASLYAKLGDPDTAFAMARASGKATSLATARAPDIQAADTLAWAAGRTSLVNGFYRDAFADSAIAGAFASALRERVKARR